MRAHVYHQDRSEFPLPVTGTEEQVAYLVRVLCTLEGGGWYWAEAPEDCDRIYDSALHIIHSERVGARARKEERWFLDDGGIDRNVITRAQYMDHTHPATHRDYYGDMGAAGAAIP